MGSEPLRDTVNSLAPDPEHLWGANITQVPARADSVYVLVVLNAWSRRIVGWAHGDADAGQVGCGRTGDCGPNACCANAGRRTWTGSQTA